MKIQGCIYQKVKVEKLKKLIELPGVFKPRRTSTPIRELDVVQDPDPSIEVIENVFSYTSKKVMFLQWCALENQQQQREKMFPLF